MGYGVARGARWKTEELATRSFGLTDVVDAVQVLRFRLRRAQGAGGVGSVRGKSPRSMRR